MDLTVVVEQIGTERYRASTALPVAMESEGTTPNDAVERLRDIARKRLSTCELIRVPLPEAALPDPWLEFAGIWRDHPDQQHYLRNVEEYRQQVNTVPPGS